MKVLLQRVKTASVEVEGRTIGAIDRGLLLFIGIEKEDSAATLKRMADKVLAYRVFADETGKMNLNVRETHGGVLAVSQFTLAADTQKGLRPGFSHAASPTAARALYEQFVARLQAHHQPVASGIFAADMQVSLTNDGPVTFLLQL